MPPYSSNFHPLEIQLNGHGENLNLRKNRFEPGTNLSIRLRKLSLHHMVSLLLFFPDKLMFTILWGFSSVFSLNPFLTILISSFHQNRFLDIIKHILHRLEDLASCQLSLVTL